MVARGEVWWAEPPDEKRRPVLVLMRDSAIPVIDRVLVAPLTSTVRGIPTEVPLDESDGVPQECVVALDNTAPISKAHLTDRLTTLAPARMIEVCRSLNLATSC